MISRRNATAEATGQSLFRKNSVHFLARSTSSWPGTQCAAEILPAMSVQIPEKMAELKRIADLPTFHFIGPNLHDGRRHRRSRPEYRRR